MKGEEVHEWEYGAIFKEERETQFRYSRKKEIHGCFVSDAEYVMSCYTPSPNILHLKIIYAESIQLNTNIISIQLFFTTFGSVEF